MQTPSNIELNSFNYQDVSHELHTESGLLTDKTKSSNPFRLHLSLLLEKNYIIQKRSVRLTVLQFLSPFLVCLFLYTMFAISSNLSEQAELDPAIKIVPKIPRCFYNDADPNNCTTVTYSIIGESEPWIHSVMEYVAQTNGLEFDKDVQYFHAATPNEYMNNLKQHPNKTYIGVIFCNTEWPIAENFSIPCKFETRTDKKLVFYNLVYNSSHALNSPLGGDFKVVFPKDLVATRLKVSIDNGILAYFTNDKLTDESEAPVMEARVQDYPKLAFRFWLGADLVSATGAFQFFIPYMIHFIATVIEVVREKHRKLRQGLAVMGLSSNVYWVSWFITSLVMNFFITVTIIIAGLLFGFQFFTESPIPVVFSMFFCFGVAMQALAFWMSTICSSITMGYTISYSFLLISIILEYFLSNTYIAYLIFMEDAPTWMVFLRWAFQILPAYNYAIIFGGIALKSGNHFELESNSWVAGPGFAYKDIFADQSRAMFGANFQIPPVWRFFLNLWLNVIIWIVFAWYLDALLYQNNENIKSPFRWLKGLFGKKEPARIRFESDDRSSMAESVTAERTSVMRKQESLRQEKGLRVSGLDKIYQTNTLWSSKNVIHAVRDMYLEVKHGELLGLLGHNGAGKTTLFGMLTGLLKPTSGTATIYGHNILTEMDKIQQIMGVCPQFDILWEELTPQEHLKIFAKLKYVPNNRIEEEIDKRLSQVNLLDVKKFPAGTFSGGMKRRLSMAIAFIGDPSIVFLDEPTTGMDPKNRRFIWELIQKMKKGRVVVLTTHAMEEADILSDRIAVISKGELRCIGTSLYLKNNYGDGYRLSLVVDKKELESVKAEVFKMIPSARIVDSSGGSIVIGVPHSKIEELQLFLEIMEEDEGEMPEEKRELRRKIKDWGLSHTTLEEVFMRIVKEPNH